MTHISSELRLDLEIFVKEKIKEVIPVSGGDINECFMLHCENSKYFVKFNDANKYPQLFELEADGLRTMGSINGVHVPKIINTNSYAGKSFLILEYLTSTKASEESWKDLARSLAKLHLTKSEEFGYDKDNYIATLIQDNSKKKDWQTFYSENRLLKLGSKLLDRKLFTPRDLRSLGKFCLKINELYPKEQPSLVHGDLWSGNVYHSVDTFYLIDPAVYYGHREMDLGMTALFGGFPRDFYSAYNEVNPLSRGWQKRLHYSQLYPLLVHVALFGHSYLKGVRNILKEFE